MLLFIIRILKIYIYKNHNFFKAKILINYVS